MKGNNGVSKKRIEFDQNIISALKKLPVPLKSFDGHDVLFTIDKRYETIFEHIANKKHHLHLVDIEIIQSILNNKLCLKSDRNGHHYRTYIGKRKKRNERLKYIKITTQIISGNKEIVITIYPIKNNN